MPTGSKTLTILLSVICILLGSILVVQLWEVRQGVVARSQWELRHEQAQEIKVMLELQDTLILGLMNSYEGAAYGSSVDRIAEQQLIAAETQIMALQALALQNRQIAELLLIQYEDPFELEVEKILNEE
jgi:hypothetical protein